MRSEGAADQEQGADLSFIFCVHIRFCGHGGLGFRSYSGLLGAFPR